MNLKQLAEQLKSTALRAGALELEHYNAGTDIQRKKDGSPVTIADQQAEELIIKDLKNLTPDIPIVAEESVSAGHIPDISGGTFWLVDPLDGTKEFVKRTGDFTVNIALMQGFQPVLGVIYTPVSDELYIGYETTAVKIIDGVESPISVRPVPDEGYTVVSSRSHSDKAELQEFLKDMPVAGQSFRGSSLKICQVAAGEADIYPRLAPTCEWDIAAGHAIVNAAGGVMTQIDGNPLVYGKVQDGFLNPYFIVKA